MKSSAQEHRSHADSGKQGADNVYSLNDGSLSMDDEGGEPVRDERALVRTAKTIVIRSGEIGHPDPSIVAPHFYNAFHHSLVTPEEAGANVTIGITSAHAGEGKTITAANIAVSTAAVTERETLLLDFNPRYPRVHADWGIDIRPGLAESIFDQSIHVAQTSVKHLHLLTAGNLRRLGFAPDGGAKGKTNGKSNGALHGGGTLTFLSTFRDVLYSLQREFPFIIVDLPAASDPALPVLFFQQMHGLVVVVDSKQTKREEIDYVVHRLGPSRVRGFVLNRVEQHL